VDADVGLVAVDGVGVDGETGEPVGEVGGQGGDLGEGLVAGQPRGDVSDAG